jgi:hypothetical protein
MCELAIVEVDNLASVVLDKLCDSRQANDVLSIYHLVWETLDAPFRNRIFVLRDSGQAILVSVLRSVQVETPV